MSTTATKERPILFRPELVRKIIEGKKTQTRRPVKPQPDWFESDVEGGIEFNHPVTSGTYSKTSFARQLCPFGQVGDVLWVRETWLELDREGYRDQRKPRDAMIDFVTYPVRNGVAYLADSFDDSDSDRCRREFGYKWSPSIHMPRWACRLRLRITDLRVERVQSISEADAIAEGMERLELTDGIIPGIEPPFNRVHPMTSTYAAAFEQAWEKAYPGSWAKNEWVWVISFKRIT